MSLLTLLLWLGIGAPSPALAQINIPYSTSTAPLIIKAAAAHYGANADQLLNTAYYESSFENAPKHWDISGYSYGEFQFHYSTFYTYAKKMGLANPDITNPIQQAEVAAYMFSLGQQRQWTTWVAHYGATAP